MICLINIDWEIKNDLLKHLIFSLAWWMWDWRETDRKFYTSNQTCCVSSLFVVSVCCSDLTDVRSDIVPSLPSLLFACESNRVKLPPLVGWKGSETAGFCSWYRGGSDGRLEYGGGMSFSWGELTPFTDSIVWYGGGANDESPGVCGCIGL